VPLQIALDEQGAVVGEDLNLERYVSPKNKKGMMYALPSCRIEKSHRVSINFTCHVYIVEESLNKRILMLCERG
jgi:hypothetical protein